MVRIGERKTWDIAFAGLDLVWVVMVYWAEYLDRYRRLLVGVELEGQRLLVMVMISKRG